MINKTGSEAGKVDLNAVRAFAEEREEQRRGTEERPATDAKRIIPDAITERLAELKIERPNEDVENLKRIAVCDALSDLENRMGLAYCFADSIHNVASDYLEDYGIGAPNELAHMTISTMYLAEECKRISEDMGRMYAIVHELIVRDSCPIM